MKKAEATATSMTGEQSAAILARLESVHNARDLASASSKIAPGRIMRSACPTGASQADIDIFRQQLGITHLIDLRSDQERKHDKQPLLLEGAEVRTVRRSGRMAETEVFQPGGSAKGAEPLVVHHCSFVDKNRYYKAMIWHMPYLTTAYALATRFINEDWSKAAVINQINIGGLPLMYHCLLDIAGLEIKYALETITEAAEVNKATLFFCKIGKDRTGVLAAMVLSCCGATRQEIIDDYVKSDQVQEIALGGIENDRALARLDTVKFAKAPAEAMAQTLDYLDRRYGGVKGYLCAVGFRADAQNRLFRVLSALLVDQSSEAAQLVPATPAATAFEQLAASPDRRYVMVSGKGGVGKTSLAASLAVKLAQAGHTTLVVSTDPAHSLSDSLDQDVSGGRPVQLEGTDLPVWGMEIDPDEAKERFRASSAKDGGKGTKDFMGGMGLGMVAEQLTDLKLSELLDTPPPGLDEAVAIAKVVEFVRGEEYARFTRIIFDTAPTGHTLRFLSVPDFVEASLEKVIRLRKRLAGAGDAVRGLFGASAQQDAAVQKLEKLRDSVRMVRDLFRDKEATEFIIATIPTVLGVAESGRLLQSLRKEEIPCKRIIVNQVIGERQGATYLSMKLKDQARSLDILRNDPALSGLERLEAPYLDLEVRGLPALTYFGQQLWSPKLEAWSQGSDRRYFMLGGKGGVGKTSSAASLGAGLAQSGHTTLVVSTDPAHSLSDSLDQDVSGGKPVAVEAGDTEQRLWGMEIDVAAAAAEVRSIGKADEGKGIDEFLGGIGLGAVSEQLKDLRLGELLDTLPPGVDEAVAISKVVQILRDPAYAHFTRVVFDTAPTGHTLRLLTLPDFLDKSIGKIVRLKQKLADVTGAVGKLFGRKQEQDPAVAKLDAVKERMDEAKALFRNEKTTEFVIVTIPTVMAASESARLAKALRVEGVPVKTLVINQVVQANAKEVFLQTRRKDQQRALQRLNENAGLRELEIILSPLVELEVRGLPALQYFGQQVWQQSAVGQKTPQ